MQSTYQFSIQSTPHPKSPQSFEERRQKLAAVAAAAALARSNSVSAASSNMKKWEVHAAHA
jgi:hypothetical protein